MVHPAALHLDNIGDVRQTYTHTDTHRRARVKQESELQLIQHLSHFVWVFSATHHRTAQSMGAEVTMPYSHHQRLVH